jgi:hypothetical protein
MPSIHRSGQRFVPNRRISPWLRRGSCSLVSFFSIVAMVFFLFVFPAQPLPLPLSLPLAAVPPSPSSPQRHPLPPVACTAPARALHCSALNPKPHTPPRALHRSCGPRVLTPLAALVPRPRRAVGSAGSAPLRAAPLLSPSPPIVERKEKEEEEDDGIFAI